LPRGGFVAGEAGHGGRHGLHIQRLVKRLAMAM
jgi:hypothetical protein